MLYVVAASAEFLFSFVVATCCIIFLDSPNDGKHSDTPYALSEASAASLARRLRGKRKKEEREERQEGEEALRAQLSYFSVSFWPNGRSAESLMVSQSLGQSAVWLNSRTSVRAAVRRNGCSCRSAKHLFDWLHVRPNIGTHVWPNG